MSQFWRGFKAAFEFCDDSINMEKVGAFFGLISIALMIMAIVIIFGFMIAFVVTAIQMWFK